MKNTPDTRCANEESLAWKLNPWPIVLELQTRKAQTFLQELFPGSRIQTDRSQGIEVRVSDEEEPISVKLDREHIEYNGLEDDEIQQLRRILHQVTREA